MKEKNTHIMFGGSALRRVLLSAVSAVSIAACSEMEPHGGEEIECGDIPVSFDAFGSWPEDAGTRALTSGSTTDFKDGDAMGVTAYWIKDGGSIDGTAPNFMYNQKVTYSSATSETGTWSYSPVKYWPISGKVNFYAWFPYAESAGGKVQYHVGKCDILWAEAEGTSADKSGVTFNFAHKLARVNIRLHNGNWIMPEIEKIIIEGNGEDNVICREAYLDVRTGNLTFDGKQSLELPGSEAGSYSEYNQCIYINPVQNIKVTVVSSYKTYSPVSVDLDGCKAGKSYSLSFSINGDRVELESSNSYIIDPSRTSTVFEIPVDRVDLFWQNNGGAKLDNAAPWTAEVIWSDHPDIVKFFSSGGTLSNELSGHGAESIRIVPQGHIGNALIGIKDEGGNYLWSWHLWITDYVPENNPVFIRKVQYMDRNLGALTGKPSSGHDSENNRKLFDLYYQFGRKDPFPRYSIKGSGYGKKGYDNNGTIKTGTIAESISEPDVFWFTGNSKIYNWTTDINQKPWNNPDWWEGNKSFFDPCPPGWRIPTSEEMPHSSTANSKFIWDENTECYILSGGSNAAYPATGGHNYSSFTGTNSTDNAIHFSGSRTYLWSSGAGEGTGNGIYNGIGIMDNMPVDGHEYYFGQIDGARAYGLNVRCVRVVTN